MKILRLFKRRDGFSVVEIILAAAIFLIFSSGAIFVVLQGMDSNRLGEEEAVANQFASEGIEAAKSIKNQGFANLINTSATGATRSGSGVWTLSGSSNVLNKYTRSISISDVQRDGNGNIVASSGTIDPLTKKITSAVTWNFNSSRPESISLVSYLSDWRKVIDTTVGDGIIIYGDTLAVASPRYRTYVDSSNTFSPEASLSAGFSDTIIGKTFKLVTSPTKQEAIAGYVNNSGVLKILCFNGTSWSNEWTSTVGGTGNTRRFDLAYEKNSGKAMVLYSTNNALTNELGYRTKSGSSGCGSINWAAETRFSSARTGGTIFWVKMATDPRPSSNLISAIWADASLDLSASVWSGTAWVNEPSTALETSLETVSGAGDVDDFDISYESLSGDLMVVWANSAGSNGVNGVRYRTCIGGIALCTWSSIITPPTFADDATNLDLSSNPNTDEMVFASIGNAGSDLQIGYWSGSVWANTANVDTSSGTPLAGTKLVATGWLINAGITRSVVVYNDSAATNIGYYVGNGSVFSAQADFVPTPVFANPQKWYNIQMDPKNKDRLMLTLSDNALDLFAKRLIMSTSPTFTWSNADGGAALEVSLGQAIISPFSFSYWNNP
jgi:type II secretory pathway pseudopilin PulG